MLRLFCFVFVYDAQIVRHSVEYGSRSAEVVKRLLPHESFQALISENSNWNTCYQKMCSLYKLIEEDFSIKHDSYGGYKLIYCGKNILRSRVVLSDGPKGILRKIPDTKTDQSVIQKTSDKNSSYPMLGPIRFIISDCEPNAKYDFSSQDKTLVRLRTLKKIKPGDEVFVKYGEHFFAKNECQCKTCTTPEITYGSDLVVNIENLFNTAEQLGEKTVEAGSVITEVTENVSDDLPQLLGECQDSSKVNPELEQTEAVSNRKMQFGWKHKCHEFEKLMR